jgi:two-component system nitrate/nitrite response regulator NarL
MAEALRVALIDDHGLCRRGLGELLELRAGMKVVATTGNPLEAIELIRTHEPDLAVIDLRMAPFDGLRLLRALRDAGSQVPVVILTMSDSREDLAAALRMGARGYLLKDMDPQDVIDSIVRAARGELVVAPAMTGKLAGLLEGGPQAPPGGSLEQLTAREREILAQVARGLSNKAIAKELGISHDTVKLHVRHILSKLGFTSRVEAAVFASEQRLGGVHLGTESASTSPPPARLVHSR